MERPESLSIPPLAVCLTVAPSGLDMSNDTCLNGTEFADVDPVEHIARSAAGLLAVKAMEDASPRRADNLGDYLDGVFAWPGNGGIVAKNGVEASRSAWQLPLRAAFADRTNVTDCFLANGHWAACFGAIEAMYVDPSWASHPRAGVCAYPTWISDAPRTGASRTTRSSSISRRSAGSLAKVGKRSTVARRSRRAPERGKETACPFIT